MTGGRVAASWRAVREVMRQPQLRRAQLGFLLACVADWMVTITLGVVAFRAGGAGAVGLVGVIRMLPAALGAPFFTALADRYRRERVLIATSVVRAAAVAGAAVVLATDAPIGLVYALTVPATAAFVVFRPAHSALMPLLCATTTQMTSASVVRGVLEALATLLGPAFAGILLATSGATAAFAVAAAFSLAAGALLRIEYEAPPRPTGAGLSNLVQDTAAGVRAVAANRDLRLLFGLGFAQTYVRGALNVFIVVVALDLLETGDAGVAGLSGALGAGGVIGSFGVSLLVASRRLGWWLAVALVIWGAPIAILAAVPTEPAAFALLAVVGLGNAIVDVPFFTLPVRLASDEVLARAFGILESLAAFGIAIGSAVTPVLIAIAGLRGAMLATGLLLPALAALARVRLVALDRRLAVRENEIRVLRTAPMFELLPVATIEFLASHVRRRLVAAGRTVFQQGDPPGSFYVIGRGHADVIGDGDLVRTVGPGDSFGEIAPLRDIPRTATVRARSPLTVFEIARDDFLSAVSGFQASGDSARDVAARHLGNFRPAGA